MISLSGIFFETPGSQLISHFSGIIFLVPILGQFGVLTPWRGWETLFGSALGADLLSHNTTANIKLQVCFILEYKSLTCNLAAN